MLHSPARIVQVEYLVQNWLSALEAGRDDAADAIRRILEDTGVVVYKNDHGARWWFGDDVEDTSTKMVVSRNAQ